MSKNQVLITQAQHARRRNKIPQYNSKLLKAGTLVMRGRLMDATAFDTVLDEKPSERTRVDGQPPATYAQARRKRPKMRLPSNSCAEPRRESRIASICAMGEVLHAMPKAAINTVIAAPRRNRQLWWMRCRILGNAVRGRGDNRNLGMTAIS
jgi:hypothetical protein